MAVLLTGGAGFIGSHTCVELLGAGEEIIIYDNFSNSKKEVIDKIKEIAGKGVTCIEANILDEAALRSVFASHNIEAVVHFAGLKAVGESVAKPLDYYTTNVAGTLKLLRVMDAFDCRRIVFSSSATVYGEKNAIPYIEEMPTAAANPYGMTKLVVERVMQDLYVSDNRWSIALLRYFNPIGANKSGLIGEDPEGIPNNLVPYIAQVAAGKLPRLGVFGDDYDTPDGTGVRDYIHVVDLALGHLEALKFVRGRTCCEAINLGTGVGYSVLDVLRAYGGACGRELPYEIKARRAGDIAEYYANPSKAKRLLGWEAIRGLDEMCEDSWRFARGAYGV